MQEGQVMEWVDELETSLQFAANPGCWDCLQIRKLIAAVRLMKDHLESHGAECPVCERILARLRSGDFGQEAPQPERPVIVCLCGSGRFLDAFERAELEETLAGKIVLTIGCNPFDVARSPELKKHKPLLDELHLRKIDLADEVLILNVGGYIGESTGNELAYARKKGKRIRFLEVHAGLEALKAKEKA